MTTDELTIAELLEERIRQLNPDYSTSSSIVISENLIDKALLAGIDNVFIATHQNYSYLEVAANVSMGFIDEVYGGVVGTGELVWNAKDGFFFRGTVDFEVGPVVIKLEDYQIKQTGFKIINTPFADLTFSQIMGTSTVEIKGEIDAKVFGGDLAVVLDPDGNVVQTTFGLHKDFVPGSILIEPGVSVSVITEADKYFASIDGNYYLNGDYDHNYTIEAFGYVATEIIDHLGPGTTYGEARQYFMDSVQANVEQDGLAMSTALALNVYAYVDDPSGQFNPATASLHDVFDLLRGYYDPNEPQDTSVAISQDENELLIQLEEGITYEVEGNTSIYSVDTFPVKITLADGTVSEVVLNPAERQILNFDIRLADAEASGTVISEVTGTSTLYGVTFNTIDKTIERTDGTRMVISEFVLPSGGAIPANGVIAQRFVQELDLNGDVLNVREDTRFIDAAGRIHDTTEQKQGLDGNWMVQENIVHADGSVTSGETYIVPSADLLATLQLTGGTAGSLLGGYLADGSTYKDIIYSTFLKTAGEHFGTFTAYLANDNSFANSLDVAVNGGSIQGTIFENPEFSDTFFTNLNSKISSVLGGLIVSEVGDVLGIDGVAGDVLSVAGSAVTAEFVSETIDIVFGNLDGTLFSGFSDGQFFQSTFNETTGQWENTFNIQEILVNAIASYAGSTLAGEVIEAESEVAAIFGSLGSALGTAIGGGQIGAQAIANILGLTAGGPIGIAIGTFIGSIAGTALGNLFGGGEDHPAAWSFVDYDPATGDYKVNGTFINDGGPASLSKSMAEAVAQGVNDILDATGGALRHTARAPELDIGWKEGTYFVKIQDGGYHTFGSSGDAISFAALYTLKNFDLVGGHAVVMRAWHNSEANTIQEWKADLEVAEAFQLYLTNPTGILAMMMDQPESALAQSWSSILQRAAELELHLPHEKDLDGGWNELLLARGDFDPGVIPVIEGDSIIITDPVTGEETVLHHVIGPGYEIVRIEGTDGNDIIEVIVDGPSITYVDAGAGDDIVEGSDERDIILGGEGDDTINGNDGDDWINGGSGEDTIHGNGGLDLIYGGDDNDTLYGDEDGDAIYGGLGDDILQGLGGNDELFGGAGNDTLNGNDGTDVLRGEEGNDILYGNDGDTIDGGKGNDTYYLNGNGSIVEISRNQGHDIVYGNTTNINTIKFDRTIGPRELWFEASGNDLVIKILGEDQSITVKDIFDTANPSKYIFQYLGKFRIGGLQDGIHGPDSYLWKEAHMNVDQVALGTWDGPAGQYNEMTDENITSKYEAYEAMYNIGQIPLFMLEPFYQNNAWQDLSPVDWALTGTTGTDSYQFLQAQNQAGHFMFGFAGDDSLIAPTNHAYETYDSIYGDSGDDYIDAGYGNDTIVGGLGNDTLRGNKGNDVIYGGAGEDNIIGGDGNDRIYGGMGNDTIDGSVSHDIIYGEQGDDILIDYAGSNILYGGEGNDTITIVASPAYVGESNILDGGEGDDILTANYGDDRLYGGPGHDILNGGSGDDLLYGDDGDDTLIYTYSESQGDNDIFDGGSGNDTFIINLTAAEFALDSVQRDLLRYQERLISNEAFITNIFFTFAFALAALGISDIEAMEIFVDGVQDDILYIETNGSASDEQLSGSTAHDHIKGEEGNDNIAGGSGHDYLEGGDGDDVLSGDAGFDDISGGAGNDDISGGDGSDTIEGGDGDDVISGDSGTDNIFGGQGSDTIDGGSEDDVISGGGGDDSLIGGSGNDKLYGESGNDVLYGNDGDDILDGGSGDDILQGGSGDDYLKGGIGNDEYIYDLGDGHDVIEDTSGTADFIRFGSGISQSDVVFSLEQNGDLTLSISSDPGSLISFSRQSTGNLLGIEKLVFNDNSEIDLLLQMSANAQNDNVEINQNQSTTIEILENDTDFDADTFVITSLSNPAHGLVVLNSNNTVTYSPDLNYSGTDSFTYTVLDVFGHSQKSTVYITVDGETLNPVNGTSSAETLAGTEGNDIINPLSGNDVVNAGSGNDTILYTNGFDTYNGDTGNDTVDFSGFSAAVWVDLDYGSNHEAWTVDLPTAVSGQWRAIANLNNVENVFGSDYHDRLWGDSGDNILIGGVGNDIIDGEAGTDTSVYNGNFANYTVTQNGSGYTVTDNVGTDGSDTLSDIEILRFADGLYQNGTFTVTSAPPFAQNDLFSGSEDEQITGNLISDNGYGMDYDPEGDNLTVNAGTITTAQGGVAVILANGDFTYTPSENFNGFDSFEYTLVDEYGASDTGHVTLTLSAVSDPLSAIDDVAETTEGTLVNINILNNDINDDNDILDVSIIAGAANGTIIINPDNTIDYTPDVDFVGTDSFRYQINDGAGDIDTAIVTINVNEIPSTITGTSGNNSLTGTIQNDVLDPLAGNDTVDALGGDDVILYSDGFDIYDGNTGNDTVDFSAFASAVWVDLDYGSNYEAWTVDLPNALSGNWRAIADLNNIENVTGSDFHDRIWGDNSANIIRGGLGNDLLKGEGGADIYVFEDSVAANGVDSIYGFSLAEGDALNISDILSGYDPLTDVITDFVKITNSGANSIVSVDVDGGADNFVQIADLQGVTGLTDEQLLETNGNLVVV